MKTNKNKNKYAFINYLLVILLGVFSFTHFSLAKEVNQENVVNLVNNSRKEKNIPSLTINPTLNKVATAKAKHMITYHYFSHYSPDGISPWHWFEKEKYDYKYAGENLAINYNTAESQQNAWMQSITHRKNILNPNYTETGVATAVGYIDKKPAFVTVQIFGTPQKELITNSYQKRGELTSKSTVLAPHVLGKEFQPSLPYHYLTSSKSSVKKEVNPGLSFTENILASIKENSQKLNWATIIILSIAITRDMVLRSIQSPIAHKPSMTNLIILVMLWSVFISI
jgi:hypothetical protein